MNDCANENEFASPIQEYEARQIGTKMNQILFNKDSHPEWKEEMADLFIEYGEVMGLTPEQLEREVREVCSITSQDIMDEINRQI